MVRINAFEVFYVVIVFMLADTTGETIEDIQGIYDTLFTPDIYNKQIRGQLDQTQVTNVTVKLSIKAIKKINELDESIDVLGVLSLSWVDQRIQWDPAHYNNTQQVSRRMEDVWTPDVMLENPAGDTRFLGQPERIYVAYDHTGMAKLQLAEQFLAFCPLDMTAFPIDTQTCTLNFIARGFLGNRVMLMPNATGDATSITSYTPSPSWRLVSTSAWSRIRRKKSYLIYELIIQRRPLIFVLNILIPIISISVLNNFVFNIPVDSGERISFALTVLLSITVLMTLTADSMPQSSVRIPSITYFLFFNLTVSVLSCICNIVTIKLYHKHEEGNRPPRWLRRLIYGCRKIKDSFSRVCCKSKREDDPHNVTKGCNNSTDKMDSNDSGDGVTGSERKQMVNITPTQEWFDNNWKLMSHEPHCKIYQPSANKRQLAVESNEEWFDITWTDVSGWFDSICMYIVWAYTALSLVMLFYHLKKTE